MWVRDLAEATPSCGGKAVGLARLIAAGLPVPPGFAIEDAAFREVVGELSTDDETELGHRFAMRLARMEAKVPSTLLVEVAERVEQIRGPLAVRSSATIEDRTAGAAAGVFSS